MGVVSTIAHLFATSRSLANATPVDVAIVDGSGNHVTSFGGSGGTSSSFGAAFPASGTAAGFKDSTGTNMVAANLDAAGFLKVNVAAGSGGNSAASATGAAVPASADYAGINVGGNLQGAVGFDLDTGAGTEYALGVVLRQSASGGSVELGTLTNPVRVNPTGTTTQPVSNTSIDVALSTRLDTADFDTKVGSLTEAAPASDTASSGLNGRLQRIAQRITSLIALLPAALSASGFLKVEQPSVAVAAVVTSVSGSATNVTLLSSNASRKGFTLTNDSTQICYVKYGTTATSSDYNLKLLPGAYYESIDVYTYTGRIDAIWVSANGAMKIAELS
jgi:hypothetical protein